MRELFRNASPGALTRAQAVALEKERVKREKMAEQLARQGRGEDTEIAHVARGELVIPEILQNPDVMEAVCRAAVENGIPFGRLRVGSPGNSINPNTGMPEFMSAAGASEMPFPRVPLAPFEAYNNGQTRFNDVMRNRADAILALQNPNVQATLDTIGQLESNNNYRRRAIPNPDLTDLSRYPEGRDIATGRYQFKKDTFMGHGPHVGVTDLNPREQDLLAVHLLQNRASNGTDALDQARDGNMAGVLEGASREWAALPKGPGKLDVSRYPENNTAAKYDRVMRIYSENLERRKGRDGNGGFPSS